MKPMPALFSTFHHLAISYDLKIIVSVILDIVYRRLLFIEEVSAVTQLGEFIQTGLHSERVPTNSSTSGSNC